MSFRGRLRAATDLPVTFRCSFRQAAGDKAPTDEALQKTLDNVVGNWEVMQFGFQQDELMHKVRAKWEAHQAQKRKREADSQEGDDSAKRVRSESPLAG